jgi:hypothetical protein
VLQAPATVPLTELTELTVKAEGGKLAAGPDA